MGKFISIIKRNGKLEYRCGNDTSDDFTMGAIEEPFDTLEDAVDHMVVFLAENHLGVFDNLNDPRAKEYEKVCTREQATQDWTDLLNKNLAEGLLYDLDAYLPVVERITHPDVARTVFLLGDKEVNVLKQADDYLKREREIHPEQKAPSNWFNLQLFEVTIDKLTDRCSFDDEKPHPELKPEEVKALNCAYDYIMTLNSTYSPRINPKVF